MKMSNAQIAQLVEQRTENPRVAGSIPALGIFLLLKKTYTMEEAVAEIHEAYEFVTDKMRQGGYQA